MFKVNDYIMYGMTGVCQVVDITKESFIDNLQKEYYVLKYIYSNDTIIIVKLLGQMMIEKEMKSLSQFLKLEIQKIQLN